MTVLIPDLLYHDGAFREGLALELDDRSGRIMRVGPAAELERAGGADPAVAATNTVRLVGRALLPGFVNAHSHAFQRLIRGRTQWRPAHGDASTFWTWRTAMYDAALRLSPDDVYHTSRLCFIEMLRAGITSVGEFHYLHNDEHGRPYEDRAELARRVIAAARDAGIRIRLLHVCYAAGGIGEPLEGDQRRFATQDLDAFLRAAESLSDVVAGDEFATVGIAPHSIRAVPRAWLTPLQQWASARDMPVHMHVSEQPAEVAACVAAHGMRPVELLADDGMLDTRFTAVHATHIDDGEVALLGGSGAIVCACPTTERDLGDGPLRAADLLRAGCSIALGSDSQTVIHMLEEARLVEYIERLRRLERVALGDVVNGAVEVAPALLRMVMASGARSLHLSVGALERGALADIVTVDLEHHTLAGWTTGTLPALLALSAPADVIADVWVGGRAVVSGRAHAAGEDAMRVFDALSRRIATDA